MQSNKLMQIVFVLLICIGLISHVASSNLKSAKKFKESSVSNINGKKDESYPFIDLNDEEVMKEQLRKIDHFKSFLREEPKHLDPIELEEESSTLRNLATSNTFDDVSIVDPDTVPYTDMQRWIFKNIKQYSSNIVVYPYAFNFQHQTEDGTLNKHYSQGAFINLKPDEIDELGLKTDHTLSIKKARALFDTDVAILNLRVDIKEKNLTNYELFYDVSRWCDYLKQYVGKGNCLNNYASFVKEKYKSQDTKLTTFSTWLNETELIKGALMNDGLPRFGVLIISDYISGTEEIIKAKFTQAGFDKIKEYYDNGGIILLTGKSGALFEGFGLINKGTYNQNYILSINTNDQKVSTKGCEDTFDQEYSSTKDNFMKQMICLSINETKKVGLTNTFPTKTLDTSFKTLVSIDSSDENLILNNVEDGLPQQLDENQKKSLPLISHKANTKNGQIFLMNFNPVHRGANYDIVLNTLCLALSRELYLTSNVTMNINSTELPDMPIPAGEAGFNLEVNTIFHNLNDKAISASTLYVFLPEYFDWTNIPTICKESSDFNSIPISVQHQKTFNSSNNYLICNVGSVPAYEKKVFSITISVLSYKSTQLKYDVLILETVAVFTDSQKKENVMVNFAKKNCEAAALLRVAINPDPSSFYPVKGEGQYIDNVVKVENKEKSTAYDVEYVGLIPVISPLTDGDDQRKTVWNLKIYVDYYNSINKFEVPFVNDDAQDFVYSAYLRGKSAVLVAEWDSPVQPVKEIVDPEKLDNIDLADRSDLKGINKGLLTINKTAEILKQINYRKSNRFFKLASQRLMVFIDDSKIEGAKTLYANTPMGNEWKINGESRAKREFIFTRLDIYFYDNENYVNPPKITEKVVFSVDKLYPYESKANCVEKRGEAESKIMQKGYFTNFEVGKRDKILEPNVFSNELFDYCNLQVIDPTDEKKIKDYFGNTDNVRPVHYLIPNVENDITKPNQIYGFVQDNEYLGHHSVYNSLKFLYVHTYDLTIINTTCIYGGKIIIDLGSYSIQDVNKVTISPDQIAVYNVVYEKGQIIAYFRRGLMSNEQFGKNLGIKLNIEDLLSSDKKNVRTSVKLKVTIQEMTYDISLPPTYEKYKEISSATCDFGYKTAWSYPALEIKAKLNRNLNGYETIEPFSRYGVYIQEIGHRTVYGTAETHHQTKPGMTGNGGGFSLISNLGISSIPFIEYLTVGRGQVIPAGPSTSRTSWKDVWGRIWHQPLRSVFPDVPPLPGPLKNFMMTTTYEVLKNGEQIYEWPSDENAQIHLHIKLLNNYEKFFEITSCDKNQIRFVPKELGEGHGLVFENTCSADLKDSDFKIKKNVYIRQGVYASYGSCFIEPGSIVEGHKVEGELLKQIERARVCAEFTNAGDIKACEEELKDIKTLHRLDRSSTVRGKQWNYSPTIERYYPNGYIEDDMWDLTHVDYDDSNMVKAHPYHMDNHLPNYDNGINKPHNTIAIPIYKGLGYSITYNKTNTMNYHGVEKHGWWGDNLQNKDDTLLAGQSECNEISVDKQSTIEWVNAANLKGNNNTRNVDVQETINKRNKNIYVCLYNRKRPEFAYNKNKKFYAGNINQNNIVPIIVDLEKDDKRLTDFNCTGKQYEPENLYQLEANYLATPTSKDYLYFAANLRGHAKESFNVLMNLEYFEEVKYEGMIKVNEGGRFVYWNPANGPNSFLVVDDPVSIVNAKRNDIEIINNLFPISVATFDAVVFHTYIFTDKNKVNKVWPFYEFYANSYGFGDVSVSVYVGGIRKSKAVINPGDTTYAKIIFYNNCGFDWNMKKGAIEFDYIDTKAISANDLLNKIAHTIQLPLKYNFLKYYVDKQYQPYIKIKPSDHNIEVAPEFFDFENINVVTIRDGFKGEYNLQINVTKDFPDDLRGKPIELKIELVTSYFDKFPGTNTDPIKDYHRYTVKVPSVYFAVPYKTGKFAGKVLYTSAQAKDLDLSFEIGVDWKIDEIKYVDKETLDDMTSNVLAKNNTGEMVKIFNEIKSNKVNYKEYLLNDNIKRITIDGVKKDYPLFPKIVKGAPDIAEVAIIIKSSVHQLPYGQSTPIENVQMKYTQWDGKQKESEGIEPFIHATGAWIDITYSKYLVDLLPNGKFVRTGEKTISHIDEGYMEIQFTLFNIGNGNSFNTRYEIYLTEKIRYISCGVGIEKIKTRYSDRMSIISFDLKSPINVGQRKGGIIYVQYMPWTETYSDIDLKKLPTELKIAKQSAAVFDLTEAEGESEITEYLRKPLTMPYTLIDKSIVYIHMYVSGKRSDPTIKLKPVIDYKKNDTVSTIKIEALKLDYTKYSETPKALRFLDSDGNYVTIYEKNKYSDNIKDYPTKKEKSNKKHVVRYKVILTRKDGSTYYRTIWYKQEEIGLSLLEKILIISSAAFITLTILFIILGIRNLKMKNKNVDYLEKEVKDGNLEQLLEE